MNACIIEELKFVFADEKLKELYRTGKGAHRYPLQVFQKFILVVDLIREVPDENALREFRSLRLEKLIGNLKGFSSLRLGRQFRLIIRIEEQVLTLYRIEDYH